MGKDSALYQLMDVRMNGVMNGIVSDDGEYQQISRKYCFRWRGGFGYQEHGQCFVNCISDSISYFS